MNPGAEAAGTAPPLPDIAATAGSYRLIREIGRGGMGTVYLAVRADDEFERRVAIKVLKPGMDTEAIVGRFRQERQILARLAHPYIGVLLDGGTTPDGRPYFAMEYVDGQSIVEYCGTRGLDTTARLELFRKVCAAVQHAHQNLIVHRDIKPANVLVTGDGTPKLLDFGIAKIVDPERHGDTLAPTVAGPQPMTPEYASPEQVLGHAVTTASDVYSLGVLLYELLTGRAPYRLSSRSPADAARVICEAIPTRPSTAVTQPLVEESRPDAVTGEGSDGIKLSGLGPRSRPDASRLKRRLAGDLDTIVMKALAKEVDRRYGSVEQLSEDIRRHLAGLPVLARRETLGYRAVKFARRNRAAVAAAAVTFLALVAGIVGTTWQARVARAEQRRAEQRFDDVRRLANVLLFDVHDAIGDLEGSTPARQLLVSRGLEYLDKLAAEPGHRPDLARELAAAYVRLGDLQGRPFVSNLGDLAGAAASYRKATAIYESMGAERSDDPRLRFGAGLAQMRLADTLASSGDTVGALGTARKAVELQQSALAAMSIESRRDFAASRSRLGDLLSSTGDLERAIVERRAALALIGAVAAEAPGDAVAQRMLGIGHLKLAQTLGNPNAPNVGDVAGAEVEIDRAKAVLTSAIAAHPTNATLRRALAVVDSNRADILLALGRPEAALASMRESVSAAGALARADPANAAAGGDVAVGRSKLGEMLLANGRVRESLDQFAQALAHHQQLAAADPANSTLQKEVAADFNRLATVQARLGDRVASLANHDRAIEIGRRLSKADPAEVELRMALALGLLGRGDARAAFARRGGAGRGDDFATAERDYVEALGILSALERQKAIAGSDLTTLANAKKELERIRSRR